MKLKKLLPLSFIFLVITSCDSGIKVSKQKANKAVFAAKEKSQFHNFDSVNFTYIGEVLRGKVVYNLDKTTESEVSHFSLDVKAIATDIGSDDLKMAVNYSHYEPSEDDENVLSHFTSVTITTRKNGSTPRKNQYHHQQMPV